MCEKVGKNSFFSWEGVFGRDSVAEGNMCNNAQHVRFSEIILFSSARFIPHE